MRINSSLSDINSILEWTKVGTLNNANDIIDLSSYNEFFLSIQNGNYCSGVCPVISNYKYPRWFINSSTDYVEVSEPNRDKKINALCNTSWAYPCYVYAR